MPRSSYDLIVVGGGIQGAFLALEAQRRSLRVLVVERGSIGQGTSQNSLRVIHGGFRYLQSLNIARFKRSRREQQWFLDNLPDLVQGLPCLLPLDGKGLRRASFARAASMLDGLLGSGPLPMPEVIGRPEMARTLGFAPRHADAGLVWHDAVMSDGGAVARALMGWAQSLGAEVVQSCDTDGIVVDADGVRGIKGSVAASAPVVVVAAGEANRSLAQRFGLDPAGCHALPDSIAAYNVIVDRPAPYPGGLGFRSRDRGSSAFFALPRGNHLVAGTLYSPIAGDGSVPPAPAEGDVSRLLVALNRTLPGPEVRLCDVVGFDVGTLPRLPRAAAPVTTPQITGPDKHGGPRGLWFVRPEKLTTARAVAEELLVEALGELPPIRAGTQRPAPAPLGKEVRHGR